MERECRQQRSGRKASAGSTKIAGGDFGTRRPLGRARESGEGRRPKLNPVSRSTASGPFLAGNPKHNPNGLKSLEIPRPFRWFFRHSIFLIFTCYIFLEELPAFEDNLRHNMEVLMKVFILAIAALGVAGLAEAKGTRKPASRVFYSHTCNLVDDFDSWSVKVGNQQADFFDNDHNCIRGYSSKTRAMRIYDRRVDCKEDNFTFAWNKEAGTAELRFPEEREVGGKKRSTVKLKCVAEKEVVDEEKEDEND